MICPPDSSHSERIAADIVKMHEIWNQQPPYACMAEWRHVLSTMSYQKCPRQASS